MTRVSDGKQVKGAVLLLVPVVLTSNPDTLINVQFRPRTAVGLGVRRPGFRTPFVTQWLCGLG